MWNGLKNWLQRKQHQWVCTSPKMVKTMIKTTQCSAIVTPHARHTCTHPSHASMHPDNPLSCVFHLLHVTPTSQHLPSTSVICLHVFICSGTHYSLCQCLTLLHPSLVPPVSVWLMSHTHVTRHVPCNKMHTVSAPMYVPTEFSLLFVQFYRMKFIVWYWPIMQAIVACWQVIVNSYFSSTCPNMLAYLLSPISQNYCSTSAQYKRLSI